MSSKPVVILCDFQNDIMGFLPPDKKDGVINGATKLLQFAREKRIPVIHVGVRFRKGYPEVSKNSKFFSLLASRGNLLIEGTPGSEHVDQLKPIEGEIMVTKRRVGAHFNTDLQSILNGLEVTHLILGGVSTSGVILSTVRWASDADYQITVVREAVADGNETAHHALLDHIFPSQANVVTIDEVIKSVS
eukprot:jgi/Galph1/4968/GphlegSOOS_G3619.1